MRRYFRLTRPLSLAIAAILTSATSASATQERIAPPAHKSIPPEELSAFVDGIVLDALRSDHIAGGTVSIVQGDRVLLLKGYGAANFQPMRAVDPNTTLFRIASISKTFTWITALKAVEERRMSLKGPINAHLPANLRTGPSHHRPITLIDLMGHRGGFEDRELGRLFVGDPDRLRSLAAYLASDLPRLVRKPGTLPAYSNYGVALTGAAVEHVRGAPFADVVDQEITAPLGMNSTTFREPYAARADLPAPMSPALAARLSKGFLWQGGRLVPQKFEYSEQFAPAASASSTAADMARYMRAILAGGELDGHRIYGPSVARAIVTPLPAPVAGGAAYRHGFRSYNLPGGFSGVGHNGVTMAFRSNMVLVPELDLGIFVATNTDTGRALSERLPALVVGHFYAPESLLPKAGDARTAATSSFYSGYYFTIRRPYGGLGEFAYRLGNMVHVTVAPDGVLTVHDRYGTAAYVRDAETFARIRPMVAQSGAERLIFEGSDSRAQHIYTPSGGEVLERVPGLLTPMVLLASTIIAFVGIAALVGALWRNWSRTPLTLRAALSFAAGSWIVAHALFQIWATNAQDSLVNTFTWPAQLPYASVALWVSAAAALLALIKLPAARASELISRRVAASWCLAAFAIFGQFALLAAWGGMTFWQW